MVGRFIEEEQIRVGEEGRCQGGARLLATRELGKALVVVSFMESKPLEGALDPWFDLVAAAMFETSAQFAVVLHHFSPIGPGGIGNLGLQGLHLQAQFSQVAQGRLHLLPERACATKAHLLGKVGDACPTSHGYLPRVGALEASNDLEQGTLASAIDPNEREFIATGNLKAEIVEDQLGTVVFS